MPHLLCIKKYLMTLFAHKGMLFIYLFIFNVDAQVVATQTFWSMGWHVMVGPGIWPAYRPI